MPTAPGPINSQTIGPPSAWSLAAGEYIYVSAPYLFNPSPDSFDNRGSIFIDMNTYGELTMSFTRGIQNVKNSGVIVARIINTDFNQVDLFGVDTFDNSGQIFAISPGGFAMVVEIFEGHGFVNSGLLAAYSGAAGATTISATRTKVINTASGQILAEGVNSVGVLLNGGLDNQVNNLENAGLIQAHSIAGTPGPGVTGGPSYGVKIEFGRVLNTGTINADIGYAGNGYLTNSGTIEGGLASVFGDEFVMISNLAGGVLRGDVYGGLRADTLDNAGRIEGNVFLDGGDDRFTHSGTGSTTGIVDLGFGADSYVGFDGFDRVAGDNGKDRIEGAGGNDLLLGGNDVDTLIGGTGNDGLYGEQGNDVLVLSGADHADGGIGNDRLELGDYAFAFAGGGAGIDTLVLPTGGRVLDLAAAVASGRLSGFEIVEMRGGQELVITAAAVAALAETGDELRIDSTATDKIDLVGAWMSQGAVTIGGAQYSRYALDGQSVLIRNGATLQVMGSPPSGAAGLDAVASGAAAPEPGATSGLGFTPTELQLTYTYEPFDDLVQIYEGETWYGFGKGPLIYSYYDGLVLDVDGSLLASNEAQATTVAVYFQNSSQVVNDGLIGAYSTGALEYPFLPMGTEGAFAIKSAVRVVNNGTIEAHSLHGMASAMGLMRIDPPTGNDPLDTYVPGPGVAILENHGQIFATAEQGVAVGVVGNDTFFNDGEIIVEGGLRAVGVLSVRQIDNKGVIDVMSPGGSVGIVLKNLGTDFFVTNSGQITADVAIRVDLHGTNGGMNLQNSGLIDGRIEGGAQNDRVTNTGMITDAVLLNDGDDIFDGSGGLQGGDVHGGLGNDQLTGGRGGDRLFGDEGNDILKAGGGNDWLAGGAGADTFVFTVPGDSREFAQRSDGHKYRPDVIADFAPGADKIDLSGIDAITGTGANDAFTFIGSAAFSHHAGEVRFETAGGFTSIFADMDGDGLADMQIVLQNPVTLTAADFVL